MLCLKTFDKSMKVFAFRRRISQKVYYNAQMRGLVFVKNVESKKEGQEINPVPLSCACVMPSCSLRTRASNCVRLFACPSARSILRSRYVCCSASAMFTVDVFSFEFMRAAGYAGECITMHAKIQTSAPLSACLRVPAAARSRAVSTSSIPRLS